MPKIYPSAPPNLKAVPIDEGTLTEIGRLVRVFAEIEDIVTLFICTLAEISESKAAVILGKTAITRRLEMAEYLASLRDDKAIDAYRSIFNTSFRDCLDCRNAVTHGTYVGQDENGYYTFLTETRIKPESDSTRIVAIAYAPAAIAGYAQSLEKFIPEMESVLQLESLRQTRFQPDLQPHPKAQPRRRDKQRPDAPPQSSEE